MRNSFFTFVVVFLIDICSPAQDHPAIKGYECNKGVHEIIAGMLDSNERGTIKSEEDLKNRLDKAMKLVGNDRSKFVSELVCFTTIPKHDVGPGLLHVGLIKYMKIPREEIFYGVIPCLYSENKSIQKQAYRWLKDGWFERDEDGTLVFSFYEKMFIKDKNTLSPKLIDYMYSESPELALSTMSNVYMTKESATELMRQIKTTPDKNENVSVDPQILLSLSKRPEWWIQLYVAKRIWKSALPFPPEILKNLEQSQHPLVVQAVAAMIEKNKHDVSK